MKPTFTLSMLSVYVAASAQIDFDNPPWETGCDSLTTQKEMNICSAEKLQIADSILNLYYNELIDYVDSEYVAELKTSKSLNDSHKKDYLRNLDDQKNAIIKSKSDFAKFVNSTTEIIGYQYEGGSMEPMAVNNYALDVTVNQIKILLSLIDEIIDR